MNNIEREKQVVAREVPMSVVAVTEGGVPHREVVVVVLVVVPCEAEGVVGGVCKPMVFVRF